MRRLDLDLAIYRDRVQLSDRETGQFVDQRAEYAFSERRLVQDAKALEHTLSHALRKLLVGGVVNLSQPQVNVTRTELPLSPSEREMVQSALANIGVRDVSFGSAGDL